MGLLYTVTATISDPATKAEYAAWLLGGHIQQVIAGGADSAMVVELTEPAVPGESKVAVHYRFRNEQTLKTYVDVHAPALRADGLARFGNRGVRWERTIGTVFEPGTIPGGAGGVLAGS